jgi:hypothetical protein
MPKSTWYVIGVGGIAISLATPMKAVPQSVLCTREGLLAIGAILVCGPFVWAGLAAREKRLARQFAERQRVHGEQLRYRKIDGGELLAWLEDCEQWMDRLTRDLRARYFAKAAERLQRTRRRIDLSQMQAPGQWPDFWLEGKNQLDAYLAGLSDVLREDLAVR